MVKRLYNMNEYNRNPDIYSLHPQCTTLTVIESVAPPRPQIFNICWDETSKLGTGACPIPTSMPAVRAGTVISIRADIANSGTPGRINVIFKIDGVAQYNDTNVSLGTYPAGGMWSPTYTGYTMPTKNVTLVIEVYGWDASKSAWVLGQTKTLTISTSAAGCTGIDLVPFSASIKQGEKVDFIVSVNPGNVPFTVTFKDRSGATLGSCKTSGTGLATAGSTCPFTWDSTGKSPGLFYIKAYANSCISTESVIEVGAVIRQWNFNVTVIDSSTSKPVQGATVLVATTGKASQSKITDVSGLASFRMDESTISVSISKDGYNTYNTAESLYMDRSITYSLTPIPPTPTTGSIEFVSIPVGADILIDGKSISGSPKTPATITDIPAGEHTWILKLTGFNDSSSKVTVPSGGTTSVYATLTPVTPTMGSLNITSHPTMGAEVWIDGKDMQVTTSGMTTITNIPPGTHTYVLTITGFKDATGKFDIKAGQTTFIDAELVPLTTIGTLEIDSEPSGARVFIDDKDQERNTPATITNLPGGDHRYILKLSGYKDVTGVVPIVAGETKTVHIILDKSGPGPEVWAAVAIAGVAVLGFLSKKETSS